MYVRNYGVPPRTSVRGETAHLRTVASEETGTLNDADKDIVEEIDSAVSDKNTASLSEDSGGEGAVKDMSASAEGAEARKDNAAPSENTADAGEAAAPTKFGEHGIPPQPLKRRKRPTPAAVFPDIPHSDKAKAERENREAPGEIGDNISGKKDTNGEKKEGYCEESAAPRLEERREELRYPPRRLRERHRYGGQREHLLSEEDVLLGGLMLLLLNDHADDDIILLLAFLFISGLGGDG
ncbi:MAG: hypothetical protein IKB34_05965 [Clostridia bacterium]|nr:hypothetical protein [Clostridia bacterium]